MQVNVQIQESGQLFTCNVVPGVAATVLIQLASFLDNHYRQYQLWNNARICDPRDRVDRGRSWTSGTPLRGFLHQLCCRNTSRVMSRGCLR